ncbi:hypothetical protein SALBM311S_12646 [Streptomyces alboniger]
MATFPPLPAPAPHLTLQIAVRPAEVAEPDVGGVDGVECHERVHERVGGSSCLGGRQYGSVVAVAQHRPVHEVDDAERRADHLRVPARQHGARDGHPGAVEGGDDAVLAVHVVRRGVSTPSGGRRSTHRCVPSVTSYVRLERPPWSSWILNGPEHSGTWWSKYRCSAGTSTPTTAASEAVTARPPAPASPVPRAWRWPTGGSRKGRRRSGRAAPPGTAGTAGRPPRCRARRTPALSGRPPG